MEQGNSNFGDDDGSPTLLRGPNPFSENPLDNDYYLESLHRDLRLYLKKEKNIPRNELKLYQEQLSRMDPQNYKHRWLLKKVKGLLVYILMKRRDFTNCLLNGEVDIWANSFDNNSQSNLSSSASASSENFSMRMLTNNNFMSKDNIDKMEVDMESYPSTQDLFSSDSTQELHNFAQENYQLFKTVVADPMSENLMSESEDDYVFKKPHPVQKVLQIHESLEEKYNSIISFESTDENLNINKTDYEYSQSIFDDFSEPDHALEAMKQKSSVVSEWVIRKFNSKLTKIKETHTSHNSTNSSLSLSQGTDGSVKIKPYYSEENYKIMKETCEKFKENMKSRKKLFGFLDV